MAATLRAYVDGAPVVLRGRTMAIEKSVNQRSTLSGSVYVEPGGAVPTVRDRIGITKDIDLGSRAFDGATSVISRAFASGTVDNWTIGIWAYVTSTGSQRFLLQVGDANDGYGVYVTSTGYWQGVLSGLVTVGGTASVVVTNTWTHVALRRLSGTLQLFVNGVAAGSTSATAPTAPNGYISVGARRNTGGTAFEQFAIGNLAHAFLAHSALSTSDLALLVDGGPGGVGVSPGLVCTGTFWAYPLTGLSSPEEDTAGTPDLVVTSSTASTNGPYVVNHDATILFAGEVTKAPRAGLGGYSVAAMDVRVAAVDYMGWTEKKVVTLSRSSESLSARLSAIVADALAGDGVSVSADQDTGPTLVARDYDHAPLQQVINDLSVETGGRTFTISALLAASMLLPSAVPAPFDLEDPDVGDYAVGDVGVDDVIRDFANRVFLQIGSSKTVEVSESFTGDGATDTWDLTYTSVSDRGYVTANGNFETLDRVGTAQWTINASNQLVRNAGDLTNTHVVTVVHDADFPMWLVAEDAGSQAAVGVRDKIIPARSDIYSVTIGQALVDAAKDEAVIDQKVITYPTHTDGLDIGQEQTFDIATRGLSAQTATITSLSIRDLGPSLLRYDVTAITGGRLRVWQQTFQQWGGVA